MIIRTNHAFNKLDVFSMCALKTYANIKFSGPSLTAISSLPIDFKDFILFISRD